MKYKPGEKLGWIDGFDARRSHPLLRFPFWDEKQIDAKALGIYPKPGSWAYGFVDIGQRHYVFGEIYDLEERGYGHSCEGYLHIPPCIDVIEFWKELLGALLNLKADSGHLPTHQKRARCVGIHTTTQGITLSLKSPNVSSETVGFTNTSIPLDQFIDDVIAQIKHVFRSDRTVLTQIFSVHPFDSIIAYGLGMLPKSALVNGQQYKGVCRNAKIATWSAARNRFVYVRNKMGRRFRETINHPDDDVGDDVFVPFTIHLEEQVE